MKKLFLILGALILIGLPGANAHEASKSKDPRVYCCHDKNNCDKLHTKADCEKEGGKVVSSCRECK
ncbi:MAG: hypothetical protein PHS86_03810 [Syntrophaceae bacterium]|nr:hypothetical protein [Syntrophaceae bacterium]